MPKLPPTPTIDAIYRHYEQQPRPRRSYLGGSEIGEQCTRMLWYRFRWVQEATFEGRILRLFETGSREEDRLIANLRAVGCTIEGEQYEVSACNGHFRGHIDGVVTGLAESPKTPHLLECKTMNKKNFDQLINNGVEKSKPVHFAQMQFYGRECELSRFAYFVQCKDDDRLYLERGEIKRTIGKRLIAKAQSIISAESPPDRIAKDPSFYLCRFCQLSDYCWGTDCFPAVNCRTCVHSEPVADSNWACGVDNCNKCSEHLFIPNLLHWTEPIDGGPGWIEYKAGFVNCAATGFPQSKERSFSSGELCSL